MITLDYSVAASSDGLPFIDAEITMRVGVVSFSFKHVQFVDWKQFFTALIARLEAKEVLISGVKCRAIAVEYNPTIQVQQGLYEETLTASYKAWNGVAISQGVKLPNEVETPWGQAIVDSKYYVDGWFVYEFRGQGEFIQPDAKCQLVPTI